MRTTNNFLFASFISFSYFFIVVACPYFIFTCIRFAYLGFSFYRVVLTSKQISVSFHPVRLFVYILIKPASSLFNTKFTNIIFYCCGSFLCVCDFVSNKTFFLTVSQYKPV